MRLASIRALYTYWNQLSAGRIAPERSEIDPKAIAQQLGDMFILDGEVTGFRFRLAGSRLVQAVGRDVTGTAFLSIFDASALAMADDIIRCAANDAEPVLMGVQDTAFIPPRAARLPSPVEHFANRPDNSAGIPPTDRRRSFEGQGELVILPLQHLNRIGDRFFGALAMAEPRKTDEARELAITSMRFIGRSASPRTPLGLVRSDLADMVIARRGHLALLRGNGR
ncbi:Protein of unknown function DUF1457 [Rhabdaerophilaceae bacterium]